MSVLQIVTIPNKLLRQVSDPITEVDETIRRLLDDMLETMYASDGVGLAAIQIGVKKRALVLDLKYDDETERPKGFYPIFMINPVIETRSDEMDEAIEGCLSVPDEGIKVKRYSSITIKYLDYNGKQQTLDASGWFARAVQHEIDHLNGILLIDYLSKLKRDMALNRAAKLTKTL